VTRSLCAPQFESLLTPFDRRVIDGQDGTIFGLDDNYRLVYMNSGWFQFAADNCGEPALSRDWGLGRSIWEAVPDILAPFYRQAYAHCLVSGEPWHHDYECSTPTLFRRLHQTAYPLREGAGLLVVNSLVLEQPWDAIKGVPWPAASGDYADSNGLVHQCCHCRRVEHLRVPGRWDCIPGLIARPGTRTSHGLCPVCLAYHYPGDCDG